MRVIAVRQSQWGSSPVEDQLDLKGSWQDRFKFAGQADIVALACSQCQATMRLVNTDFLGACKPGVTIINVARGKPLSTRTFGAMLTNPVAWWVTGKQPLQVDC